MATKPKAVSLDYDTAKLLQANFYETLGRLHREHEETGRVIGCMHRQLKQLETACELEPMPELEFGQK